MKSLEASIESLKDRDSRKRLMNRLENDKSLVSARTPHASFEALDVLVDSRISRNGSGYKNAIVKYEDSILLSPYRMQERTCESYSWEIRKFGRLHNLMQTKEGPDKDILFHAAFQREFSFVDSKPAMEWYLTFTWQFDGRQQKKFRYDSPIYQDKLPSEVIRKSRGVAMRRTTCKGELNFCGTYNLGAEQGNQDVIIFYNKKSAEFFNLSGTRIKPVSYRQNHRNLNAID